MGLGSGIQIQDPKKSFSGSRIPDPRVKIGTRTGSQIQIRNTVEIEDFFFFKGTVIKTLK
jgi:hypothetical protein